MIDSDFQIGLYQSNTGIIYRALFVTRHYETGEQFVVYVSLNSGRLYTLEMCTPGKDSWDDIIIAHDGSGVPRFKYCGP
jgi:hypothetical protein